MKASDAVVFLQMARELDLTEVGRLRAAKWRCRPFFRDSAVALGQDSA